jgi:hypothetical protein
MAANRFIPSALVLLAAFAFSDGAQAQEENQPDKLVMSSEGFLNAHPDLKWRQAGLKAYEAGKHAEALGLFRKAARYADKPSQGMVAEMLWRGEGVAQDRPSAYAWMDLASERHFRPMLIQREIYWEALSEGERNAALEIGKGLYAEYGDAVAQPRTERKMRTARRNGTGSRTGYVGNLTISFNTMAGPMTIDGSSYYHPDYWEPQRYWTWQEKGWKNPPRGIVGVGPLSSAAPSSTTPPAATTPESDEKQ